MPGNMMERLVDREKWPLSWWHPQLANAKEVDATAWLAEHEQLSRTLSRVILVLIGYGLFCVLTLGGTDLSLMAGEVVVPFANVRISFRGFLIVGPIILIGIAAYLHIFLEHYHLRCRAKPASTRSLPFLFTLPYASAKLLSSLIFYWLSPLVMVVFAYKAAPWTDGAAVVALTTGLITLIAVVLSARREAITEGKPRLKRISIGTYLCGCGAAFIFTAAALVGYRGVFLRESVVEAYLGSELVEAYLGSDEVVVSIGLIGAAVLFAIFARRIDNVAYASRFTVASIIPLAVIFTAFLAGSTSLNPFSRPFYLSGANLSKQNLEGADLRKAVMWGADLNGALLNWADMQDADMGVRGSVTILPTTTFHADPERTEAKITVDFEGVNTVLTSAKLRGASLIRANLSGADLQNADLAGSRLLDADLIGADLRRVRGLTCEQLKLAKHPCWMASYRSEDLACGSEVWLEPPHEGPAPARMTLEIPCAGREPPCPELEPWKRCIN